MRLPCKRTLGWIAIACLWGLPARAADLAGGVLLHGQVREGDRADSTEAPTNAYGVILAPNLHHGVGGETYFRLDRDWSRADGASDFYLGFARVPFRGLELSLGRQLLDEVPGALYVADAGRLRVDRGGPLSFSLFGGQPRYFEPLRGPEIVSQDEQIFGGSTRLRWLPLGQMVLTFAQLQREQRRVNQLVGATWGRNFLNLPWRPQMYALATYDTAERNLQQATGGGGFALHPRVFARVEASYYKPSARSGTTLAGLDRFVDPLFSVFSVASMRQARGGLQFQWRPTVYGSLDYAFQTFEESPGKTVDGNRGSVGVTWLPEGDGLEWVRAEVAITDSRGGDLYALRGYYENRVYQRILFRTKIEVAGFDKVTNESDTVVSGRMGVGYEFVRGLLVEVNFEGNRSPRFDQEFRLGFFVTYNAQYRNGRQAPAMERPVLRYPGGWAG
ncbi:MAG: hypothetical protein KatS3mg077_1776 [Candidatus Binatia bacterium]|nr:MAG: hypothetical protein KatS3mg077_1776 [Candidatus Binatia bacterium]